MTDNLVTAEEVLTAYLGCRANKRRKPTTIEFENDLYRNIMRIVRELNDLIWQPSSAMCFAVTQPRTREIWAARFADRVVHHVIYNRLRPRFEPRFIRTSFACIEGRGALAAANWAQRKIRSATGGWTQTSYALQADVANFFPSIDRRILLDLLLQKVDEPWLDAAVRKVILTDVREGAHFPGNPKLLDRVPQHKSLWQAPDGKGLPIGNLTSQFAANIYLNELDQFVTRHLRPRAYGRYVDDVLLIDRDPTRLADIYVSMCDFLKANLLIDFHPDKTSLIDCAQGVDFVGWVIAPHRRTLRTTTVRRGERKIEQASGVDLMPTANSYFGLARHGNTYRARQRWADRITDPLHGPSKDYSKVVQYKIRDKK